MSAFTPEELAYLEAHKDDSRVSEIHWVYSIPIAFGILSTALRLWAKSAGRNGITLDDWLIVVATTCLVGECAAGLGYGPPHGMGRHVIAVSQHDQSMVRQGDYVFSHFYDFALVFVKLGILAFYHRVFVVPAFRKTVVATAAFVIAWGIGITVTLALACRPIEAFWDASVKGDCLNLVQFTYFTNITNLITDVWIFLMPVPVIWHLQLQTKKKLLLCFIFSVGIATCIVSAIRLTVVLGHGYPDFTWSYVPLGAYSAFEPFGGILCTNLPIIWHMYRKQRKSEALFPGSSLFRSKRSSPSVTAPSSSRGSHRSRIARSLGLGLSSAERSATDSQTRDMLAVEEGLSMSGETEMEAGREERAAYFGKVERVRTQTREVGEGVEEGVIPSTRRTSASESGSSSRAPRNHSHLKKNVWEVRRKS